MKLEVKIELFETHDKVNFYTLVVNGQATEIDKFFDRFPEGCPHDEDIDTIIKWIDKLGERGALERYLRNEGRMHDNVYAIPIETANLRLYIIRLSDHIVILGNGGVKSTATYNEDEELNAQVELLQQVDSLLRARIRSGQISHYQKELFGNLCFHLK